jgi:hypothetical protein
MEVLRRNEIGMFEANLLFVQLVDMDGIKVVVGNKQCDPSVWLDRLATVFR